MNRIREILKDRGIRLDPTNKNLQEKLGIKTRRMRRILANSVVITGEELISFANYLDVEPSELIAKTEIELKSGLS